ncbi:MAG: class I SAM-dependent methyltransferase [Crocinitomicaceae bacterium]
MEQIAEANPIHAKKLRKNLGKQEEAYLRKANDFLEEYVDFASRLGKDLEFGVECYLRMLSDFTQEYVSFMNSGEYTTKSFEDANRRVYNNPDVMEYYMHGLLLSQVLWVHHNDIVLFFQKYLPDYNGNVERYLEIGAGHGMYISEAMKVFGPKVTYDVVDISPTSIELSKNFIKSDQVNYVLSDIYDYQPDQKYDFITLGEVIEHVEQPVELLMAIRSMLAPDGCLFLTTPANAPAIDHIYLFRNAQEIRDVLKEGGFEIVHEITKFVEDVPKEIAEELKITLMYGAFLKVKN